MRGPRRIKLVAVAASMATACAGPVPAGTAPAFDLQCDHARYRIHLARHRWCEGDCSVLRRLTWRRGDDVVTLSGLGFFEISYDRRAGEVSRSFGSLDDGGYTLREPCSVQAFSDFPRRAVYRPGH